MSDHDTPEVGRGQTAGCLREHLLPDEYRVLYQTTTGSWRVLLETFDESAGRVCVSDFRELGKTVSLESREVTEWVAA